MTLRITICNQALSRTGLEPIQSETADGADTVLMIYDGVTANLVSLYDWHFCQHLSRPPRLAVLPDDERDELQYKYAFKLPPNRTGPPTAIYGDSTCSHPLKAYALRQSHLWADMEQVWIKYVALPDPLNWPGYFTELVLTAMMAEIAISEREDKALANLHYSKAFGTPREGGMGGLFATARSRESSSKPSPVMRQNDNVFMRARRF